MRIRNSLGFISLALIVLGAGLISFKTSEEGRETQILSYIVNPKQGNLRFFWKDTLGNPFGNFKVLNEYCTNSNFELTFALNGGMYLPNQSPQGLFIEEYLTKINIDTSSGYGNFYLKPTGVFYITKQNDAIVQSLENFYVSKDIRFATQSGPMLLIDGNFHPAFKKESKNLYIRNGVGILPNKSILFAISMKPINFYDFANYFKSMGCLNALYLDGYVSRTYLPSKHWIQTDGAFGVIIAEIKSN